jgi:hypothetical protein
MVEFGDFVLTLLEGCDSFLHPSDKMFHVHELAPRSRFATIYKPHELFDGRLKFGPKLDLAWI